MDWIKATLHYLGTPVRAVRALFPFSYEGRQTLIYLMCAFSAPILTLLVVYILNVTEAAGQWAIYAETARLVAYSLLIITCAFAMFVAFRSLQLGGKDGLLSLTSKESPDAPVAAARKVAEEVKATADEAVEQVAARAGEPAEDLPDYAK